MPDIIDVVDYFIYEYSGNKNPRRDRFDSGQNMVVVCFLILLVENGLDIKKKIPRFSEILSINSTWIVSVSYTAFCCIRFTFTFYFPCGNFTKLFIFLSFLKLGYKVDLQCKTGFFLSHYVFF
ncbi:unnamed protein product [Coffea canephora]|uniref:Uncharacterized protein n=1 Tax=Coffea canephora TaxID=49390 RepID=A0A068UAY6_COFCA|nr:unnamed protein product [Coffea canephora]